MIKIKEISRSFSKTFQEAQFEPFNVFASYKGELEGDETAEEVVQASDYLYELAQEDVRRITDMWTNRREANKRMRESKEVPFK